VELFEPTFRVRQIVARVKLGLREDVLSDPSIWACTRCFACVAHCPKNVRPGDLLEALRHLALREGRQGPGPRHARAFASSVREDGRINEARVTIRSVGLGGLVNQGALPVKMALRGKAPSLRRHRLRSISEIETLLEEESP